MGAVGEKTGLAAAAPASAASSATSESGIQSSKPCRHVRLSGPISPRSQCCLDRVSGVSGPVCFSSMATYQSVGAGRPSVGRGLASRLGTSRQSAHRLLVHDAGGVRVLLRLEGVGDVRPLPSARWSKAAPISSSSTPLKM